MGQTEALQLAETIRRALIAAAEEGYQAAAVAGLCGEGAWEAAISAMQMVNLKALVQEAGGGTEAG